MRAIAFLVGLVGGRFPSHLLVLSQSTAREVGVSTAAPEDDGSTKVKLRTRAECASSLKVRDGSYDDMTEVNCLRQTVHINRPKEFFYGGRNYFFSGHLPQYRNTKVDWLDARNICREYCMDLVTMETQEENNLIFRLIQQNDVPYIWTSGRLCDFKGCEGRRDLEPKNINGWFWSGTRARMTPTNQVPPGWGYNAWSSTGHKKTRQPDNAEFDINGTNESCLSVLNNVYNDGIAWHDVACYHEKPFICEDSDELLNYVASTNRGIRL